MKAEDWLIVGGLLGMLLFSSFMHSIEMDLLEERIEVLELNKNGVA